MTTSGPDLEQGDLLRDLPVVRVRGDVPPLTLLHARDAAPTLPWSVVDLRELHVLERGRIDGHVARPDHRPRLRLASPYREHFAQAFARFFMRVGLPHDAGRFVTEGAVADLAASG